MLPSADEARLDLRCRRLDLVSCEEDRVMDIPLPRDLEELVEHKVETGEYESASAVVIAALYLLAARDRFLDGEREALRREIQIGIDQCERGEVAPFDRETVKRIAARGRKRLAEDAERLMAEAQRLADLAKQPTDEPVKTD
jgi:antitoxin ParD1/3/4